jgi:outer membrane biosynthesis protein TonB
VRRAFIASAALHVAVIAAAFIGLPELFEPKHLEDQVVNVEVVSLQDAAPKPVPEPPKEAPKPPPAAPEPPKAAAAPPPPPPPPPPPEPAKAPEPLPKPEAVKQPEPPKPKPPEPEPQQVQKPAPPAPKPKPAPPPDQLATLLKNLKQEKAQVEKQEKTKEKTPSVRDLVADLKPSPQTAPAPAPQVSSIDQRRDAATLAAMVAQQISPCWAIPAGARDAADMRIGIRITLNPDGSLRGVPNIQDRSRMGTDDVFRAFGESAIRALQQCSPLRLPADKYALWQDMIVNFDPKQAVGP